MKEDTGLDTINKLMSTQLSEREAIFYMLCDELNDSSMSFRELGSRLGISHENVRTTYITAKAKIQAQADAGLFVTEI